MKKRIVLGVLAIAIAAIVLKGTSVAQTKEPAYVSLETYGDITLRDYSPMIVAEVTVSGERGAAIREGFRLLADYIFGNSVSAQKVAMTAPVMQQKSDAIAMTAPVMQQSAGDTWGVRFVMPATYTLETLPVPVNAAVRIFAVPAKRFAAIRFSGLATEGNLRQHRMALHALMQDKGWIDVAAPIYAFYNPPWTLPFLRRNEVMIEVQTDA
jgi:hypothetical protein